MPAPSQLAEIETETLGPRGPVRPLGSLGDDLLREETFSSVARPARLELPEAALDPVPAALSLPEIGLPDRPQEAPGRLTHTLAFAVTLLLHAVLLVVLDNGAPRYARGTFLVPAPSSVATTPLRVVLMDDAGAPPPEKRERSASPSDRDRSARGGEIVKGGHTPKLRGESSEPIYSPNRGRQGPKEPSPSPRPPAPPVESAVQATPAAAAAQVPTEPVVASSSIRPDATRSAPLARPRDLASQAGVLPSYKSVGDGGLFGFGEVGSTDGEGTGTEGSVSFETSWFDWSDYAAAMLRKIKWNWVPPHALYVGIKGHVRVSFVIQRSGEITDVRLERSSGTSSYDEAAITAIESSSPLATLPADFPFGQERVTINFLYNMRRVAASGGSRSEGTSGG